MRTAAALLLVDQSGVGDQLGKHHRHGLQGFDLDFRVATRIDMLDSEHADHSFTVDDGHAGEGMEPVLARFRPIGKVRVRCSLCQVECFIAIGNGPD